MGGWKYGEGAHNMNFLMPITEATFDCDTLRSYLAIVYNCAEHHEVNDIL